MAFLGFFIRQSNEMATYHSPLFLVTSMYMKITMNGTLFFLLLFLSISYVFLILFVYNECRRQENQNVMGRFYVSAIGKPDRHDRFFLA